MLISRGRAGPRPLSIRGRAAAVGAGERHAVEVTGAGNRALRLARPGAQAAESAFGVAMARPGVQRGGEAAATAGRSIEAAAAEGAVVAGDARAVDGRA